MADGTGNVSISILNRCVERAQLCLCTHDVNRVKFLGTKWPCGRFFVGRRGFALVDRVKPEPGNASLLRPETDSIHKYLIKALITDVENTNKVAREYRN